MMIKEYNKLVRDCVPEIIKGQGRRFTFHIAGNKEYENELYKKLFEEVGELIEDPNTEEAADILEVLDSIFAQLGLDYEDILQAKKQKQESHGSFNRRIILETAERGK